MNVELVTNDELRDHKWLLQQTTASSDLFKWQRGHQIRFKFTGDKWRRTCELQPRHACCSRLPIDAAAG